MIDRYTAQTLTLAESCEDALFTIGTVEYRITKCAFNADCVLFTRMTSQGASATFLLSYDELKVFLEAYNEYRQHLEGAPPRREPAAQGHAEQGGN
jgi:hypothetical protein